LFASGDRSDGLQPQAVFLLVRLFVLPIEKFAVGIATVIQKSQWRGRFQQFSAGQTHAIIGVVGVVIEDFPLDFAENSVGGQPTAGKNALSHGRFAKSHQFLQRLMWLG
jgi:hypothetical protein